MFHSVNRIMGKLLLTITVQLEWRKQICLRKFQFNFFLAENEILHSCYNFSKTELDFCESMKNIFDDSPSWALFAPSSRLIRPTQQQKSHT